ncbi:hypothetical protein AbraIFM66951_005762 [Aspergillus brasiliensis]|uniref:Uncharacterized protein n=1 Tax=Aspergillus brasiliensis TaxID=319629 RepID=A0A9W5YIB0_9EURO|nr:hypothetical protein AbraCBS73388_006021 [Aspergillus brasiliensis]GKZ44044.1 hypothetical protein AbraIFM66951_005762 [Aspergillus brasiliensis]
MHEGSSPQTPTRKTPQSDLIRLFHYTYTTWRDSAAAIRQELIELSDRWSELGSQWTCPYSFTDEERKQHAKDYGEFEAVQSLKLWLKNSLNTNSDGWVPNEAWGTARDAHRAAYDEWIQTARGSEARGNDLTMAKAEKLWPFDAR